MYDELKDENLKLFETQHKDAKKKINKDPPKDKATI